MNFLFIVTLVFLAIAFYMLFIKYKIHCNIVEGLAEDSLKDVIYKIAVDNDAKISDINKLTAIQNLLYVSTEASEKSLDPIEKSISQKNAYNEFIKLPQEQRSSKIESLRSKMDQESAELLTMFIPVSATIDSTPKEYTYVEKIYNIVNDKNKLSNEKIASIKELSYLPPVIQPQALSANIEQVDPYINNKIRTPTFLGKNATKTLGNARKNINKLFARKKKRK